MSTAMAAMSGTPVYMDPDTFDLDIFTLLGIADASDEKKHELLEVVTESVNNRVFSRVLDLIEDDAATELEHLLDTNGDIDTFLKARDIDVAVITAQEALIYKTELAALVARPA